MIIVINFIIGLIFGCWFGIFIFAILKNSKGDENLKEGEFNGEKTNTSEMDKGK